MRSTRMDAFY